jgi:aspartate racemase
MHENLCIGIIGGMSPQSTVTYYQTIIDLHYSEFGEHSYPRIVIGSIPFKPLQDLSHKGDWDGITTLVQDEGEALIAAGADFLVISANTIHKVIPGLRLSRPLLAVYDAVALAAGDRGCSRIGLTGTRFTMADGFYQKALEERGLEVILPASEDQDVIHQIIYEELVRGEVRAGSINRFVEIGKRLTEAGAEAVLLGCTELEMLTRDADSGLQLFDTAYIHARAAWEQAVGRKYYPLTETAAETAGSGGSGNNEGGTA